MADVKALIRDPRFRMLTPEQQKMAASQVDERIGQLNDEQFRTFVTSVAGSTATTAGTGKTGSRLKGEPKPSTFFKPMVAGEKQIEQGYGKLGTGVDPTIGGVSDIVRGTGQLFYPYAAAASTVGGLPSVIGAASTVPLGMSAEAIAKWAGVPEGTSQAIGDAVGIGGGYLTNKLAGAFGRNVAPYVAKIPMLPAKWKAGLKTLSYLTPDAPAPAGEYLQHTEPRPGGWSQGLGIGPREGPNDAPLWLRNLRNFRFDDMEKKLRGQSAPPSAPPFQPETLPTKRAGGFGSTGLGGRPRTGAPKTTFSPETLDYAPDPTAPRTVPTEAPPAPPVPTKKAGGFGRTGQGGATVPSTQGIPKPPGWNLGDPLPSATGETTPFSPVRRPPMGPPKVTESPETLEPAPQKFTPTTIPEPPLPQDIVRGAERESAAPLPEDAPPKFGTPEYADWFSKTWPDLPVPPGASGTLVAPENLAAAPEPSTTLKPDQQAAVERALKGAGLAPTVTPPPGAPVTPPAATGGEPPATGGKTITVQHDYDLPQRYEDLVAAKTASVEGARLGYLKDQKVAQFLLDNGKTVADWDAMTEAQHNEWFKKAQPDRKVKPLGSSKGSRPYEQAVDHIRQTMQELQGANAMRNPPEPIVPKPVEKEMPSNAERQAVEPGAQETSPIDVAANEIYGSDYISLRPNAQVSLRRFYSSHGNRYPTIDDVKSGEFKRR